MVVMVAAMDSIAGISNHQSDTALTNQAITQDSLSLSLSLSLSPMNRINPNQSLFPIHNATQSPFAHKLMSIGRGAQPIEQHRHHQEEARVCV